MIDQGLAANVSTYVGALIGVGTVVLLALVVWGARSPLTGWFQRRTAARDLHRAADDFSRRNGSDNDAPLRGTPHPAH